MRSNESTRIFAIHLPQFHRIAENDLWWGEGFTEWDNVKSAKPLYDGHVQPLIPLGHDYYDLLQIDSIVRQHELAKMYGIDGFIYYHYWFNGKLLLEKPLELLLNEPKADRQFCLCWANESWTRAWDGKEKEIIMKQTYGGVADWERHISYLIPFLSDSRYAKVDGRPLLFVYSPNKITDFDSMIEYWNARLFDLGLPELYVVEYLSSFNPFPSSSISSAVMEFEPLYSAHYEISKIRQLKRFICKKTGNTDYLDYDYLWKRILNKHRAYAGKRILRSAFTNFDNSPRKGKKAFITKNASPEKFEAYFEQLLLSERENQSDIVVINAWNEWGEGAILEPTMQFGHRWLEAVSNAKNGAAISINDEMRR